MSSPKRTVKAVLRPVAQVILRPVYRRMDEIARLAERVDRHLPIVENVIESQNAELRARTRESAEIRAELGRLREDLVEVRQQLDALRDDLARALPAGAPDAAALEPGVSQPRR